MNITRDIINDLYPLYAENECSADTRALVEAYLKEHPEEAAELRRGLGIKVAGPVPEPGDLGEAKALLSARRVVRRRSWLMGLAIFFSVAPLSFTFADGKTTFLFAKTPLIALGYLAVGAIFWIAYVVQGRSGRAV